MQPVLNGATSLQQPKLPQTAPPVYRPTIQPAVSAVQQPKLPQTAPPVYRPTIQPVVSAVQKPKLPQTAPPVYRPTIQPAVNAVQRLKLPQTAPPVYRPTLQAAMGHRASIAPTAAVPSATHHVPTIQAVKSGAPQKPGKLLGRNPAFKGPNQSCTIQRVDINPERMYHSNEDDRSLLQDYALIQAMLRDSNRVKIHLAQLNQEMKEGTKLNAVLTKYENMCGFSSGLSRFGTIMTRGDFFKPIALGQHFKDRGAPPEHGEYTHRIQWFVIMREVTDGFTTDKKPPYHHTPLELYKGLSNERFYENEIHTLWDDLVDSDENNSTQPEFLLTQIIKGWSEELPEMSSYLSRKKTHHTNLGHYRVSTKQERKDKIPELKEMQQAYVSMNFNVPKELLYILGGEVH